MGGEDVLRPRLVEAERERERVAARVRDVEELADRRNVGLAIRAVEAFGDVEDDVGSLGAEALGEVFGRLEADHVAVGGERGRDGVDRFGGVPLRDRRRSILGGSSSGRDSDVVALTSPTVDSGFWLYANPMRVIQSLLSSAAIQPPESRSASSASRSFPTTWGAREMPLHVDAQNTI